MSKGLLVLISGPSGVGKGTIIDLLKKRLTKAVFLLSETTRKPRPGEKDGEVYHFVSKEEFQKNIDQGLFLEWAIVHETDYYGLLNESVQKYLDSNRLILREIDIQGLQSIRKILSRDQLLTIFIAPESENVLLSRIEHRGSLPEEELQRRMESMKLEMAEARDYDYTVINYDHQVERCYMEVESIIRSAAESRGIILGGTGGSLV